MQGDALLSGRKKESLGALLGLNGDFSPAWSCSGQYMDGPRNGAAQGGGSERLVGPREWQLLAAGNSKPCGNQHLQGEQDASEREGDQKRT